MGFGQGSSVVTQDPGVWESQMRSVAGSEGRLGRDAVIFAL